MPYRLFCFVPFCQSSFKKTPEKLFIQVPDNKRKMWLELANLDPTLYSQKTRLHFCEDHFDLANDMENYRQYKIMGSVKRIRMKSNCRPTKFDCQPGREQQNELKSDKNENISIIEEAERTLNIQFKEKVIKTESNGNNELQKIKTEPLEDIDEVAMEIKNEVTRVECFENNQLVDESQKCATPLEQMFKCDICNKFLASSVNLERHNQCKHLNKRSYDCSWCNKSFWQRCNLIVHERVHTDERPFICPICKRLFRDKSKLNQHARVHTGERPFVCSICERPYKNKSYLNMHIRQQHRDMKPIKCKHCNQSFKRHKELSTHQCPNANDNGEYKCSLCPQRFLFKRNWNEHLRFHDNRRLYSCSTCQKAFTDRAHLKKHELIHVGVKPFVCSICSKSFLRKHELPLHQRVHTGVKPFKCLTCDKSYSQNRTLKNHNRRVHKNETVKSTESDQLTVTTITKTDNSQLITNIKSEILDISQVIIKKEQENDIE